MENVGKLPIRSNKLVNQLFTIIKYRHKRYYDCVDDAKLPKHSCRSDF